MPCYQKPILLASRRLTIRVKQMQRGDGSFLLTKIDRYIFVLFARTILICFCSLAGVFVVFHAFNHLDDLAKQANPDESFAHVLASYYGPYLLMLFDWTASIITLMAMLFTIGWLRRSGELTALLSAGVNHGRILRPMIAVSFFVIVLQVVNREVLIPPYRDLLTAKPGERDPDRAQSMLPSYDKSSGILIEGNGLLVTDGVIKEPHFRLYASYRGFGDVISANRAIWQEADGDMPSGYLLIDVFRPEKIDQLPSGSLLLKESPGEIGSNSQANATGHEGRMVIYTANDTKRLKPGQCFIATTLNIEVLRDNPRSTRMAAMPELIRRVRNSSVHSSEALRVMLHERFLRPPLDFCLVLLGLPLVVNRGDKRLFTMIAQAMGIVLLFFGLKTLASGMGGSGYMISPSMAAWLPLLVLGPASFVRYRDVQLQ
jgi:lipopolysaccharide export system permease protein